MSTPEKQTQALNPLKRLEQDLAAAKNVKDMVQIPFVRDRFIKNYEAVSQRKDGEARYEKEVFAFTEIAYKIPDISQCDPFSVFAAFVKAGTTGLSFSDGNKLYPIVRSMKQKDGTFKKILTVDIGAHGKREMIDKMPNIDRMDEAVVVFNEDDFEYSPLDKKVTKHTQKWGKSTPKPGEDTVKAVYVSVHFKGGRREEVVMNIHELKAARSKSKMNEGGALWIEHYGEAAKKSVYNRAFKVHYKYPDTAMVFSQFEPEEETIEKQYETVREPDFTSDLDNQVNHDASVGKEEIPTAEVVDEPVKEVRKKKEKKPEDEDGFL